MKTSLTINCLEILAFATAIFFPRKLVNKALIGLFVLTVEIQVNILF
jgi:hypothetical protein